jgi:hypothetical protein
MLGYLRDAWTGWLQFTDSGKLAALFAAAAAYLLLAKKVKGAQKLLTLYASGAALLCVVPVTAMVLMLYQTRFYDYQWIWSIVPLTAVTALGGTVLLTEQWKCGCGWKGVLHNAALAALLAGVLVLGGGLGEGSVDAAQVQQERAGAEAVLDEVQAACGEDFCLWAPKEILEYVRAEYGTIRLLYGRNMWDEALNAYSYDTYPEEICELYLWMEGLPREDGTLVEKSAEECVREAAALGADCILLPETAVDAETAKNMNFTKLDGYYLLSTR